MAEKTIFQKILDGEIKADIVYQDDVCGAIRDINAQAPTHLLVIPRKPISGVAAIEPEDEAIVGHCLRVARKVAEQEGLKQGYRLVINQGEHGQQTVPHLHIHVLGGRPMNWPPG